MILKSQKLVKQINVSCRFKLMTLVFNKTLQCIFFTIKGSAAKKKFENLRARYSREKQRIKKAKKSGTSSDEVLSAQKEASDAFPYRHFLD